MAALKISEKQKESYWEHDAEADVLYMSIGQPKIAEGIDVGEGMIVRVDPQLNEMVGLTLIGLRQRILNR